MQGPAEVVGEVANVSLKPSTAVSIIGSAMELFDATHVALGRAQEATRLCHDALAANIANANTHGYRRVDVNFRDALAQAMQRGRAHVERLSFAAEVESSAAMRVDGNTVDIDVESAELAANALENQALVAVAHGRSAAVKTAIGVG